MEQIDLSKDIKDEALIDLIDETILGKSRESYIGLKEKNMLRKEIFNAIRRFDILQELVDDDQITEIMVNGPNQIFIEKEGGILPWEGKFESKEKLEDVIQHIVSKSNRIVNEAHPIVDVRMEDGSRVNVVLPPVAIEGPIVTIRKFPKKPIDMEKLIKSDSITTEAAVFLEKLVIGKYNIFISGGTGSGKTTFLNILSNFIPKEERIIIIEDSAELQINMVPNLVRLEVRNANVEGMNQITMRDLLKTALRMRPDRIIIGEVRDAVAVDMLSALNTGHTGNSTGHSNGPKDMLSRLESLVLMGMEIPLLAVRKQIASAIDIIVHLGRMRDRSRRVLEIVEVLGCVNGEIEVNPLYLFQEDEKSQKELLKGKLVRTNKSLKNKIKLERAGIEL
jgi:pilus assembly protein CpaF